MRIKDEVNGFYCLAVKEYFNLGISEHEDYPTFFKVSFIYWVGFYGTSTIVGYLIPNPLYTYISNIYDLVWLGFMAHQPLSVI